MNYFVEGLQGSGKSTMTRKLLENRAGSTVFMEGDYSPVELAWCAYVDEKKYEEILKKYSVIRDLIEKKTVAENEKRIICYTKIRTDIPGFYEDLEQYEIYNGRTSLDEFRTIILERYKIWNGENMIFECSLFQNTVEDMILFRCSSDEEIISLYRQIAEAISGKDYHIVYLKTENFVDNLNVIRKERSDEFGNELWFPVMCRYFNESPYAQRNGLNGEDDLIRHFQHRQKLELRICQEVFPNKYTILESKRFKDEVVQLLGGRTNKI